MQLQLFKRDPNQTYRKNIINYHKIEKKIKKKNKQETCDTPTEKRPGLYSNTTSKVTPAANYL